MSGPKRKGADQQWIGVLIYMLTGAVCGGVIVEYMDRFVVKGVSTGGILLVFSFLLLVVCAAILVQVVIHEAGHLVFGLLSGYRFSSFRIFNWMWLKENGKLRLKRLSLAGTGGQCLMGPPDLQDGKMPILLYNFGGSIANLITSAPFFGLSFLVPGGSFVRAFLRMLAIAGAASAVMNGIPMHLGPVDNDGCNAVSMLHSQEAVRAFWVQLKTNEMQSGGTRLRDMPEAWFTVPDDQAMRNSIIATAGVLACSRLVDEHRFEEADALAGHLLSIDSGIISLYRSLMTCDRIYMELIGENRRDILDSLMTKEQKKLMKAMRDYPSVLRTEYAFALIAGQDEDESRRIRSRFEKTAASYPYPCEIQAEKELMTIAEDRFRRKEA